MPKVFLLAIALLFVSMTVHSQSAQWAWTGGGSGYDVAQTCKVAPNGNVYVAGQFSGTMDLDPTAGTFNITANGAEDMFLACYTSAGALVWGFNVGGSDREWIFDIAIDGQGNVFTTGFFRGTTDFDPSAAVANITDNTTQGYAQTWMGEMFIAKYSSAGAYQWAVPIGAWSQYDMFNALGVDGNGNVYAGGVFVDVLDADPSANVVTLNSGANGKLILVKFSPTGQLVWAKNFGTPGTGGVDLDIRGLEVRDGNIYCTGFFSYTADFDPNAGVANFTSNGPYDAYVAKYDTAGNYVWAIPIGGSGYDDALDLRLDAVNNIYVTGLSHSPSVTFSPYVSSTVSAPVGSADENMMMAKYNGAGVYQWGRIIGAQGTDRGWDLEIVNNSLYVTGLFTNTVDFDPSVTVNNLTSNGDKDIFLCQYDLNGNYICGFGVGGTPALWEEGCKVSSGSGGVYVSGSFAGTNVDLDPTAAVMQRTSNGNVDAFLVKYIPSTGNVYGVRTDTICVGQTAYITVTDSTTAGTFTVTLNDGFNTYTYPNVQSGVPFALNPSPTSTTTYTWNVGGQALCGTSVSSGSFTLLVNPQPTVNAGPDVAVCNNTYVQLNGSGASSYSWTPSVVLNNPNIANPTLTINDTAFTFTLIGINSFGCADTDQVNISTHPSPVAVASNDTAMCAGGYVQLQASGGGNYTWYPTTNLTNPFSANPLYNGAVTTTLNVVVTDQYNCSDTEAVVVTVDPQPIANAGADISECSSIFAQLNGSGGGTYTWTPASVLNNAGISNPTLTVTDTVITFTLITTNGFGCSDTDQVNVSVHTGVAAANAGPDTVICPGFSVQLLGSGGTNFNWYPATGLNNTNVSNPIYTGGATTIYLVVTDQYNCSDTDQVDITIAPVPVADAGQDQQICANASVTLQGSGGGSYNWYPTTGMTGSNTATPTVIVNTPTTYYIIATNGAGCSDTDDVQVSIIAPPDFEVTPERDICIADSVELIASGGNTYQWYPNENISATNTSNVIVWPTATTTYYVVITEPLCNYIDTQSVVVNIHQPPAVKITKAVPIGCGQPFGLLEATGAMQYVWTPSTALSDDSIANPASTTTAPTWYTVMGTDMYGCVGYDSVLMRIIEDNMSGLFVPTAFTPNNDGKNDCYRILLPPGVTDYELHIYNRFGNNVFDADDAADCWDGTYKGKLCDMGVYFYYYKLKSATCGFVKEGKGDITLIR